MSRNNRDRNRRDRNHSHDRGFQPYKDEKKEKNKGPYLEEEVDANPNHPMLTINAEELPRGGIVYYCKECKKIVTVKQQGRKMRYKCDECGGENIAYGTEKSIKSVYKIKEPVPAEKEAQ